MLRAFCWFALLSGSATLQASPVTFDFNLTGTDSSGDAVSATAVFTIVDSHDFTITLTNTSSMQNLEQLLAGVDFSFSSTGVVLVGSNGEFMLVNADGSITELSSGTTGWGFEATSNGWVLCAECSSEGNPDIIGTGPYSAPLAGTYLGGTVTFDFTTTTSLPSDGSDPFGNVTLLFGFGNGDTSVPSGGSGSGGSNGGFFGGSGNGNQGPSGNGNNNGPTGGNLGPTGGNQGPTGGNQGPTGGQGPTGQGPTGGGPSGSSDPPSVPEPATLLLTGAALLALGRFTRKAA